MRSSALTQAEFATASAEQARDEEKRQRQLAETERQRVSEEREKARLNLYAADMKAVNNYLADGSLGAARALLQYQMPRPGESDLRGWEWRYFNQKAKGDHLFKLVGHTSIINRLAFSPSGRLLLSRGYNETILWDWRNKTMLRQWENVKDIGFSYDGFIGLLNDDARLELLDPETFEPTGGVQEGVQHFAFSPRENYSILVLTDGKLVRWNHATSEAHEFYQLKRPADVVFSPDGEAFGWIQGDVVSVWNVADATIQTTVDLPAEVRSTFGLFRSPRALAALFAGGEGLVVRARGIPPVVYRAKNADWERPFPKDAVGTNQMMMSRDGDILVTGSYNHDVSMWSVPEFEPIARLYGHGDEVFSVAITADGQHLASGSQDKSILIWSANRSTNSTTINQGLGPAPIVYSKSSKWMATPTPFFTTTIRNPETFEVVSSIKGVAVHELPDQSELITAKISWSLKGPSLGHEFTFWNTNTWQPAKTISLPDDTKIGAAANGTTAAIANESQMSLIDLTTHQVVASWKHGLKRQSNVPLLPLAVGSGGISVGAGSALDSNSGVARVWDLSGRLLAEFDCEHIRQIVGVACSPDERYVATASFDATIKVWNVASKSLVFTLRGHRRGVHSIDFSPDGKTLVSYADDRMVKLWHVATGRELATLYPKVDVGSMQFSPDGSTLIGQGLAPPPKSSQLQIWRAPL